jgi:hypothetical protein
VVDGVDHDQIWHRPCGAMVARTKQTLMTSILIGLAPSPERYQRRLALNPLKRVLECIR